MIKTARYRTDIKTGEVLAFLGAGHSALSASRHFGCSENLIRRIENGTRGLMQKTKVSMQTPKIMAMHADGMKIYDIQKATGLSHSTIYRAIHGSYPKSYYSQREARRPMKKNRPKRGRFRTCRICGEAIDNLNYFFCSSCHSELVESDATNTAAV